MGDPGRPWLRVAIGLVVLGLALFEAHTLTRVVQDQASRRQRGASGSGGTRFDPPQLAFHLVSLGAVLAAGSAWLYWLGRRSGEKRPNPLNAYEEAMGRLRDRGAALSRQHQQERQRLLTALDEKDTMARAGELTSGIVHEVRNGLGTIAGYAQLVERGTTPENAVDAARQIAEECRTLEAVVRRFVEFVKHEELRLAPMDLGRMLARVAAREGRSRPGGEVILPADLDVGTFVGDEELLETAFENLVRNAREAAGPGGHVWIHAATTDAAAMVMISDDGPGLEAAPADVARPFFTTKAGGLGLGLPTAMKVVHLHGGELSLLPRHPKGLEVTVALPRQDPTS